MKIISNYHTHTHLCNHAKGDTFDYIKEAIALGFKEIGISDHNALDLDFFNKHNLHEDFLNYNMSKETFNNIYLKELEEAKKIFKDKIKIYKGSEAEFFIEDINYYKELKNKLDYLILGIHFYLYNGKLINSFTSINDDNIEGYFITANNAIKSGLFKIFAHPDLFIVSYFNDYNEIKFTDKIKKLIDEMCLNAIKYNVALEFNINGIRNSYSWGYKNNLLYPNKIFFEYIKKYQKDGLKIVLGIDAHDPKCLNDKFINMGKKMIKSIGLDISDCLDFDL